MDLPTWVESCRVWFFMTLLIWRVMIRLSKRYICFILSVFLCHLDNMIKYFHIELWIMLRFCSLVLCVSSPLFIKVYDWMVFLYSLLRYWKCCRWGNIRKLYCEIDRFLLIFLVLNVNYVLFWIDLSFLNRGNTSSYFELDVPLSNSTLAAWPWKMTNTILSR